MQRGLESYKKLTAVATEATEKFDSITSRQKEIEKRMSEIKELRQHIFNYAKAKKIYAEYKAKKYDERFFEEHREPLTLYKAAKEAFKKYDGPIPTIRELDAEFQKLLQEKRQFYSEYKTARAEMQELLIAIRTGFFVSDAWWTAGECRTFSWRAESAGARHSKEER